MESETKAKRQTEDMRPLLTIAIPTYNRSRFLKELLSSLFGQLIAEPRVELIISDNASPDETPAVVADYVKRGLRVRYLRNETNVGSGANFLQCFEQAGGKYVWIFADDDIIVPGGVAKILTLLTIEDYALVHVSSYGFRSDYVTERTSDRFGRLAEVIPDGLQFARRIGTMITFISGMIVNKDIYTKIPHPQLTDFVDTSLPQLGWLLPVLASSSNYLYVWERLVAGRNGNRGGWDIEICQIFGVNFERVIQMTLGDRGNIAKELRNSTLRAWFPTTIMAIRLGKSELYEAPNMHEKLVPIFKNNWRYWIYIYPVIKLPLGLAGPWYSMTMFANWLRPIHLRYVFSTTFAYIYSNAATRLGLSTKQIARV
jgi:glycosyltransferase involved in cell wall biosynthesis